MTSDFLAGFLSGAALIMAIGSQNSFVLRQGIRREHVLPIVLLCAGADALLIGAGVAGLGALIQATPIVLDLARYGGALFLAFYGVAAGRRAFEPHRLVVDSAVGVSLARALSTCMAFTFLNPHVYLDTVILLGALASQRTGAGMGHWVFATGAIAASFAWFFALGFGARLLAPLFSQAIAWRCLDALISLTMLGLSVTLLVG